MLSVSREKLAWYEHETYTRQVLDELERGTAGRALDDWLWSRTFLVVKPDGIAAGRLAPVLEFVETAGYACVGALRFDVHGLMWRELWRYQLTAATLDRLEANQFVLEASAVMLLLVRTVPADVPAAVELSSRKGSATLELQRPGTLRHVLGQPNRVLSHVHLPDEPADVLRELGILLTREQRAWAVQTWDEADVAHPSLAAQVAWVREQEVRPEGMSLDASVARIREAIRAAGTEHSPAVTVLGACLDAIDRGGRFPWRDFVDAARALAIDRWDVAVVGTSGIQHDRPGTSKLIGNVTVAQWRGERPAGDGRGECARGADDVDS